MVSTKPACNRAPACCRQHSGLRCISLPPSLPPSPLARPPFLAPSLASPLRLPVNATCRLRVRPRRRGRLRCVRPPKAAHSPLTRSHRSCSGALLRRICVGAIRAEFSMTVIRRAPRNFRSCIKAPFGVEILPETPFRGRFFFFLVVAKSRQPVTACHSRP